MSELAAAGAPVEEAVGQRLFAIEALSEQSGIKVRLTHLVK